MKVSKIFALFTLVFVTLFFASFEVSAQKTKKKKKITWEPVVIQPKSSWNAQEPKPYKQHVPVRITVHHEGGRVLNVGDDAKQRLKNVQTWSMGPDRKWADIPYHIF